jgi:hypothetical protein
MKDKFLPWFLLFCALGLSGTAAYYSVIGLSVVFVGVAIPVIIMGSFLEISKIAIATYLHDKWKETYGILKIYMTTALITLSLITSLGIYGLLSTGFQENIAKLEISDKKIKNVELKKTRFSEIKDELIKEKTTLDGDITKLREGLSTNTTTQSVDRKTGQIITKANNANRRTFENQLRDTQSRRDTLSKKIDGLNDSITNLDVEILNMESEEIEGSELGTIKYLSEVLDWDIKRTANLFILILIFVFDPLAITLVIATNQAFKGDKKDEDKTTVNTTDYPVDTPQVPLNYPPSTPQVKEETPQVPTKYRPSTDQVDNLKGKMKHVWETVRKLKEEGKLPEDPTDEELLDEPTALAFTPYVIETIENENEEIIKEDETNDIDDDNYIVDEEIKVEKVKPMVVEKIVEVPVEVIKEVEKIVEVPVYVDMNNMVTDEEYFEKEDYHTIVSEITNDITFDSEQPVEEVPQTEEILTQYVPTAEPKRLSYTNRNGGSLRINRF